MKRNRKFVFGTLGALAMIIALCAMGCARFSTKQIDRSYDYGDTNRPSREIITKASATTFFSAKSDLAKFKATQTDKSQSATVGSLSQEGGQTNQINDLAGAIVGAAVKAAAQSAKP